MSTTLPTAEQRRALGREARSNQSRAAQGEWRAGPRRGDPIAALRAVDAARIPTLLPLRYGRMRESAFAYMRGTAAVMAADLGLQPSSGLHAQSSGDAHLMNFGSYASPEGRPVFDLNDFDETLAAPFEWDVKRLATSLAMAAAEQGASSREARALARRGARLYRMQMNAFAAVPPLKMWRAQIDLAAAIEAISARDARHTERKSLAVRLAASGDLAKHLIAANGTLQLPERPPGVFRLGPQEAVAHTAFAMWRAGLAPEIRALMDRFELRDVAFKAVGIGSVGTFCALGLFADADGGALILQLKQAQESVLEGVAGASPFANHGQRVVVGQRIVQASPDPLLGWSGADADGRCYYVRQMKDARLASVGDRIAAEALKAYAGLCARTLAHAHARGGEAATLAGYMGGGEAFENAVAAFAMAYAAQIRDDFALFSAAIDRGELPRSDRPR